jgi:predicted nicotinamide N-methyase
LLPDDLEPPDPDGLATLLDRCAPLRPCELAPEVQVFHGLDLMQVWQGAEALAGRTLPAPFWAYAWPAGAALARVLLDRAHDVARRRVLDLGCGGGVASLAAARAGARVVANDIDPWALATAVLAAERQGLPITTRLGDVTADLDFAARFDIILCADVEYDRRLPPALRPFLHAARAAGARVFLADAGRAYFAAAGLHHLATFEVAVPPDLEGARSRTARVFELP